MSTRRSDPPDETATRKRRRLPNLTVRVDKRQCHSSTQKDCRWDNLEVVRPGRVRKTVSVRAVYSYRDIRKRLGLAGVDIYVEVSCWSDGRWAFVGQAETTSTRRQLASFRRNLKGLPLRLLVVVDPRLRRPGLVSYVEALVRAEWRAPPGWSWWSEGPWARADGIIEALRDGSSPIAGVRFMGCLIDEDAAAALRARGLTDATMWTRGRDAAEHPSPVVAQLCALAGLAVDVVRTSADRTRVVFAYEVPGAESRIVIEEGHCDSRSVTTTTSC